MKHFKISLLTMLIHAVLFLSPAQAQVTMETWQGATLASPQELANSPGLLGLPTSTANLASFFEQAPLNIPGNFVARYMAKIVPPISGSYYFWIAANQKAMLWVSPDSPNFSGRTPIAKVTLSPPPYSRQWTRYAEQRSVALSLVAGRTYYLLAIETEADGDNINHTAVGWYIPGGIYERPIPGSRLTAWSYPPMIMNFNADPLDISTPTGSISLSWLVANAAACTNTSTPLDSSWNGSIPNTANTTGSLGVFPIQTTTYQLTCVPVNNNVPYSIGFTVTNSYNTRPVQVAWDPNPETDLAGYRLYFGTAPGTYSVVVDVSNVTSFTLTNDQFPNTAAYYFALTAYNTSSLESGYSNEVSTFVVRNP